MTHAISCIITLESDILSTSVYSFKFPVFHLYNNSKTPIKHMQIDYCYCAVKQMYCVKHFNMSVYVRRNKRIIDTQNWLNLSAIIKNHDIRKLLMLLCLPRLESASHCRSANGSAPFIVMWLSEFGVSVCANSEHTWARTTQRFHILSVNLSGLG